MYPTQCHSRIAIHNCHCCPDNSGFHTESSNHTNKFDSTLILIKNVSNNYCEVIPPIVSFRGFLIKNHILFSHVQSPNVIQIFNAHWLFREWQPSKPLPTLNHPKNSSHQWTLEVCVCVCLSQFIDSQQRCMTYVDIMGGMKSIWHWPQNLWTLIDCWENHVTMTVGVALNSSIEELRFWKSSHQEQQTRSRNQKPKNWSPTPPPRIPQELPLNLHLDPSHLKTTGGFLHFNSISLQSLTLIKSPWKIIGKKTNLHTTRDSKHHCAYC